MGNLPTATITIGCGSCGDELDHDGDRFVCWDCRLVYDPDDLEAPAWFLDPREDACGRPHHQGTYVATKPFQTTNHVVVQWRTTTTTFGPCVLPATHTGLHEHPSQDVFEYHDTNPAEGAKA